MGRTGQHSVLRRYPTQPFARPKRGNLFVNTGVTKDPGLAKLYQHRPFRPLGIVGRQANFAQLVGQSLTGATAFIFWTSITCVSQLFARSLPISLSRTIYKQFRLQFADGLPGLKKKPVKSLSQRSIGQFKGMGQPVGYRLASINRHRQPVHLGPGGWVQGNFLKGFCKNGSLFI
jgi:hypothetical protein